jgi:hypothetical protein
LQRLSLETMLNKVFIAANLAVLLLLIACRDKFTIYDKGLQYRIFTEGDGELVQQGQTMKLQVRQQYHDSILNDTPDSMPFYQLFDSVMLSKASYEIFGKLRIGDSVVFKALTDSAFKNKMPAFVKKGEWLYTRVHVRDIFWDTHHR